MNIHWSDEINALEKGENKQRKATQNSQNPE